jgi:hypothetical protein
MPARQLTQVYLDADQKEALQKRAETKGTKVSEEIRSAVDVYLAGLSPQELDLLDAASREAEKELKAMAATLDATNDKLDAVFAEMERMQAERKAKAR